MATLSIYTLGQLQIAVDGKPVVGFDSDKVRALLLYLAAEVERPHRREALAGLLWPDFPDASARTNLRRALANLRKVIGDQQRDPSFLIITRQSIQFNRNGDAWLDLWEFGELIEKKGSVEELSDHLERAIALYRGPFLEGFSVRDSAAFEEWALVLRQQTDRQVP